jgi:hypothetical protein
MVTEREASALEDVSVTLTPVTATAHSDTVVDWVEARQILYKK